MNFTYFNSCSLTVSRESFGEIFLLLSDVIFCDSVRIVSQGSDCTSETRQMLDVDRSLKLYVSDVSFSGDAARATAAFVAMIRTSSRDVIRSAAQSSSVGLLAAESPCMSPVSSEQLPMYFQS